MRDRAQDKRFERRLDKGLAALGSYDGETNSDLEAYTQATIEIYKNACLEVYGETAWADVEAQLERALAAPKPKILHLNLDVQPFQS